jgi:hypothetical protein
LKASIWQRGFSEVRVLTAAQFEGICSYIRENPVVRHLSEHANKFLYSSAHSGFALDAPPQGLKPEREKISDGTPEGAP